MVFGLLREYGTGIVLAEMRWVGSCAIISYP